MKEMTDPDHGIPGVILAGGSGRRIGGDKPLRLLAGRPLWTHVVDRIAPQVGALAVNADAPFGDLPTCPDTVPDQGPLGGILAAMEWAQSLGAARVLTVAVDTPFLPANLAQQLSAAGGNIAMAESSDGLQGATALWSVSLADALRVELAAGLRKVTDFAAKHDLDRVKFADTTPPPFFNINTSEDLAQAEVWLR